MTAGPKTRPEMPKAYNPAAVERSLYERWEKAGYFKAEIVPGKEPFTIIMPPPNLTGELHLGHAMMDTVEDILTRWHRMKGDPTLWLPGVDHAALAVNTLVERELQAEGLDRREIGREKFLERVWAFVNRSRARIFTQHKRLGVSCDWSRERFTMDPGPARAVRTIFKRLFDDGLIYRGNRIINWCPRCLSALSDLEVDHEDEAGFLWHVRYQLVDEDGRDTGQYITIATTRPETIVADTAIAVHPEDARYRMVAGRLQARVPVVGRLVRVITDEAIEREFGTGALKVTPGHDPVDFEIGERHGLPVVTAIGFDGKMNAEAGPYAGMDRFAARDAIVRDLKAQGLLVQEEPYTHAVGHCDRCGEVVEPLISEQWFVAMTKEYGDRGRSLAGDALKAVVDGWTGPSGKKTQIKIIPERHYGVYKNWLENIRDWCISRQIWWGHRIPVWYCDACGEMTVAVEDPERCQHCGAAAIRQDEDTLDTWFSSALWPFSTLGWPEQTEDLKYFYPTSVMETGYDIIFLWVARMIMMGIYAMDDVPFEYVYFHGTVRDDKGQRMSKSKGNGVDPEVLIDRHGSDALRFKLVTAGGTGNDQRLEEPRIEAARNFANKLWNASRFVLSQLEPGQRVPRPDPARRASLPAEDRWILSRLEKLTADAERLMGRFELGEAGREMHEFIWDEFCDWYLEIAKVRLRAGDEASPLPVLVHCLDTALRLLHPYMPYVTDEIWSGSGALREHFLEDTPESIMVAAYPQPTGVWLDEAAETELNGVMDIVRAVRNIRRERNIDAGRWIEVYVASGDDLSAHAAAIEALARVRPLRLVASVQDAPAEGVATAVLDRATVVVPLAGLFDVSAERANLVKQRDQAAAEVARLRAQLANREFTSRAPANVVQEVRGRLAAAESRLAGVEGRLRELGEAPPPDA
jgi:valyl-tRNA synthetase